MTPDDLADIETRRLATARAESWEPVFRGAPEAPAIPKSGCTDPPRSDLELALAVKDLLEISLDRGEVCGERRGVGRTHLGAVVTNEGVERLESFFRDLRREWLR